MADQVLKAAVTYADLGLAVFPLKPRGKTPLTAHGFKDATTNTAIIQEWWQTWPDANIGIYCRGLLVLDFDEQTGYQSKCWLEKDHQPLPDTWVVKTGGGTEAKPKEPGGQYVYRVSDGTEIKPGAGKYGYPNLDVRAGESYICAVPSVTRLPYQTIAGSPESIALAPQWLIDFVLDGSKPASKQRRTQGEAIRENYRNATLASIGGAMRRQGADQEAIKVALLEINTRQCHPPLAESEVLEIAKSVGRYEPDPEMALPEIITTGRHLRDITTDALSALYRGNDPPHIFRRSGALTRIGTDEKGRPFAETLTEAALRGKLARAANFVRMSEKRETHATTPPLDVTRDIESLGVWQFPPLAGITESPVLRHDGTVLTQLGYDPSTGLYYVPAPGLAVPTIPEAPIDNELSAAVELVIEILCDFPFDSEASRANGYGALITPILRPAIDGPVPMPVIDKPMPGSGASLMADIISIIATGHLAATMGVPQSEEEWEKKLSSHLLAGRSLCVIDNAEGKLYSDTLSRYLTSTHVSIRPLGRSADIILANNLTFVTTGNNIRLGGDMPRRCYWVRLDPGCARPWLRKVDFKHPKLQQWVSTNRGAIIGAILTIARAWVCAGRPVPEGLPMLGGFEAYCYTIGGLLAFMGIKGFLANLLSMYDKMDADTPQWESFLESWRELIGEAPVTVAELVKHLNESEDLAATLPDSLATRDKRDYSRRLGNAFAKRADVRLPNGLMLVKGPERKHAKTWAVVSYETANSPLFSYKTG